MASNNHLDTLTDKIAEAMTNLNDDEIGEDFANAQEFLQSCGFVYYSSEHDNWAMTENGILALHYLLCLYSGKVEDMRKYAAAEGLLKHTTRDALRCLAMKKAGVTATDVRVAVQADDAQVMTV